MSQSHMTILSIFREKTALWYVDPNNQETKLSYESLSLASQKAANAIQGLGAKRAVCILPRVRAFLVVKYQEFFSLDTRMVDY